MTWTPLNYLSLYLFYRSYWLKHREDITIRKMANLCSDHWEMLQKCSMCVALCSICYTNVEELPLHLSSQFCPPFLLYSLKLFSTLTQFIQLPQIFSSHHLPSHLSTTSKRSCDWWIRWYFLQLPDIEPMNLPASIHVLKWMPIVRPSFPVCYIEPYENVGIWQLLTLCGR